MMALKGSNEAMQTYRCELRRARINVWHCRRGGFERYDDISLESERIVDIVFIGYAENSKKYSLLWNGTENFVDANILRVRDLSLWFLLGPYTNFNFSLSVAFSVAC